MTSSRSSSSSPSSSPLVLIVTRSDDHQGVAGVMRGLQARGCRPVRFDTDRHPLTVRVSTRLDGRGRIQRRFIDDVAGVDVDLNAVGSVWYRRFLAGGGLPTTLGDLRGPSVEESRRTAYGLIAALGDDAFSGVPQLDPLEAVRRCDHKELQLRRAAGLGLRIPETLFSNDPALVRAFVDDVRADGGVVVTKMQSSFAVFRSGLEHVVFTSVVDDAALMDLDGLRYCPMQFQRRVDKRLELRATVVGDDVFCAAVDSQQREETSLDWRKDGVGLLRAWERFTLPRDVETALLRLVRSFGLGYAAADIIVTPDDELVFLEINAGGEWYWLDEGAFHRPGFPIADAIAGWLARGAGRP
jgi:glutathione synthase/RimK-type ligase-like ATP-grasp enzyme